MSFLLLFQLPRFMYEPFISKWKEYDCSDFMEGMAVTFCRSQFDTSKFFDDYLTSDDDLTLFNEMFDIVRLLGTTLQYLLFEKTDALVSKKCKTLAFNYNDILKLFGNI